MSCKKHLLDTSSVVRHVSNTIYCNIFNSWPEDSKTLRGVRLIPATFTCYCYLRNTNQNSRESRFGHKYQFLILKVMANVPSMKNS